MRSEGFSCVRARPEMFRHISRRAHLIRVWKPFSHPLVSRTPPTGIESNISRGPRHRPEPKENIIPDIFSLLLRKCVQYTSIIYLSLSDILVVSQIPLARSLTHSLSTSDRTRAGLKIESKVLSRPSTSSAFGRQICRKKKKVRH
jgi:hypothetical protein